MVKKSSRNERRDSTPSQKLIVGIENAHNFLFKKQYTEACELLENLNKNHPRHPEILLALMDVYYELGKMDKYELVCEQLVNLKPKDPDLVLSLAGAYMHNGRPSLALRTFKEYITIFPTHESVEEARKTMTLVENIIPELLPKRLFSKEENFNLTSQVEQIDQYICRNLLIQATALGIKLIQLFPEVSVIHNYLSKVYWMQGMAEKAIGTSLDVLEFETGNIDALCDLNRYYFLTGHKDLAQKILEKLDVFAIKNLDQAIKYDDALVFQGNFKKIVELYNLVEKKSWIENIEPKHVIFLHMSAVGFYRLENEDQARKLWIHAIHVSPDFRYASDNLRDLNNAVGDRHAPWIYPLPYWISSKTLDDLDRQIQPQIRRNDESGIQRASLHFLENHKEVLHLAPVMLEVGDLGSRMFVLKLTSMSKAPTLLEAVNEFSMGKFGSDEQRLEAARLCCQTGLIPTGMRRFWSNGRWIELLLLGVNVSDQYVQMHEKNVKFLLKNAIETLSKKEGRRAESLLQQAINLEPDAPDLLYNLALAYQLQGRINDSIKLLESILEQHPDYLFGRIGLALVSISKGDLENAHELLDPLLSIKRMSLNEFDAFCDGFINLHLAEKRTDIAKAWYGMWNTINPETAKLRSYPQFENE